MLRTMPRQVSRWIGAKPKLKEFNKGKFENVPQIEWNSEIFLNASSSGTRTVPVRDELWTPT
jgi:hypothetical protein